MRGCQNLTPFTERAKVAAEVNPVTAVKNTAKISTIGGEVSTPYSDKQLFRIYKREKSDDEVTVYARHIYYDNLGFL